MRKIVSVVIAVLLFVNSISFALSPQPASRNKDTQKEVYALARKAFAMKIGPGSEDNFLDFLSNATIRETARYILFNKDFDLVHEPRKFKGKAPGIPNAKFIESDYDNPPESWNNHPIFEMTNLIDALKYFRDNEAKIPSEQLEIEVRPIETDLEEGEIPVACIEPHENKSILVIDPLFVQAWNDIRRNDVWFEYKFSNGTKRTVSLAWGLFYRLAKHEMADLTSKGFTPKGGGHILNNLEKDNNFVTITRSEINANKIGGRYNIVNDAIWAWFLTSYCFSNTTRYNNRTLRRRLKWLLTSLTEFATRVQYGRGDDDGPIVAALRKEFPMLETRKAKRTAIDIACAINYHYYSKHFFKDGSRMVKPIYTKETRQEKNTAKLIASIANIFMDRKLCVRDGRSFQYRLKENIEYPPFRYKLLEYFSKIIGFYITSGGRLPDSMEELDRLRLIEDDVFAILPKDALETSDELRQKTKSFPHMEGFSETECKILYSLVIASIEEASKDKRSKLRKTARRIQKEIGPGERAYLNKLAMRAVDKQKFTRLVKDTFIYSFGCSNKFLESPDFLDMVVGYDDNRWLDSEYSVGGIKIGRNYTDGNRIFVTGRDDEEQDLSKTDKSVFKLSTLRKDGPGIIDLTHIDMQNIWKTVNLLHLQQIEIYIPQQLGLDETIKKSIRDMSKKQKINVVTCKFYSSIDKLKGFIKDRAPNNVKRIIITKTDMAIQMGELVKTDATLFRNIRLLNLKLPDDYESMEKKEKAVYQRDIIAIAILARLLEKDNTPMVKAILKDMLCEHLEDDEKGLNDFIDKLAEPEGVNITTEQVKERVLFFLNKVVTLGELLDRELRLMREFWTYA